MNCRKVLQVNKLYPYTGGIEKVVQQLAEGLKDKLDMEVLACRECGFTQKEILNGVSVIRAGSLGVMFSLPISIPFLWKFRKMCKDKDVIQFHMPFPLGDVGYLLSDYKGKVVVWWHSDVVRQKLLMKLYQPIMEKFLSRADVIIVATQGHIDGSDYLNKYRNKCVVIPYGIEKSIELRADKYIQNRPAYIKEKVNILFVGRLVYYKGCEVLLKAFCSVHGAELTMIGTGKLDQKLKEMAVEYGLTDKVHFLGSVSDEILCKAFEECDVFVLPSIYKSEAFGIVQIEAMAYGKPVINTRLPGGVPYVSLNGITGLTVEPSDIEALTNAMQWMVDHPKERESMGMRARERVKEHFTEEDMLDKVLEIYEG
jgi:glycosyltransferase involved in cell wall biosynthesis